MRTAPLSHRDLPDALRLSTLAGWNQTEADWRRLLDVAPHGCLGGWAGDALVASATLACYGNDVGWVGMVLVDPGHRRQGYGSRLFDEVLRLAASQGCGTIGLDATDQGRPLYRRHGFVDAAPIVRWGGRLAPAGSPEPLPPVRPITVEHLGAVCRLDAAACGADRRRLLEHLLRSPCVCGFAVERGDELAGYGLLRPGRRAWQLGPWIARDAAIAEALLWAVAAQLGGEPVLVDALEKPTTTPLLSRSRLAPQRTLTRMSYRRPTTLLDGAAVWGVGGLEWG